jgi:hypothetical protein
VQCQVILGPEGLFDLIYRGALEEIIWDGIVPDVMILLLKLLLVP